MSRDTEAVSVRAGAGVSRRQVAKQLGLAAGAVGAFGGLAGCFQQDGDDGDSATAQGDGTDYQLVDLVPPPTDLDFSSDPPDRQITMVTHDAQTSFFNPTIGGLHDAASQLGWDANFTGPTSGNDTEEQINILESVVDSRPDVIATTVNDPNAFDNVLQDALDNDIAVVLYNTNSLSREEMRDTWGQTLAYTGQDQVAAGYVVGLAMLERLPDDAGLVTAGLSDAAHSALSARADGMEQAIEQEGDGIELTNRLEYSDQPNEAVSNIEGHLEANQDLDGIMGADAYTWTIGNALENAGLADEVVGGGFDLTTETMDHIANGTLQFTIGQDPYSQGYVPTLQMFAYLERGMPPKDYPTGAEVIDESNIEFAIERSGGWSDLLEYHDV